MPIKLGAIEATDTSTISDFTIGQGQLVSQSPTINMGSNNINTLGNINADGMVLTSNIVASSGSKLGDITISDGSIVSGSADITFGQNNLTTTGTLNAGNSTLGDINVGTINSSSSLTVAGSADISNVNVKVIK